MALDVVEHFDIFATDIGRNDYVSLYIHFDMFPLFGFPLRRRSRGPSAIGIMILLLVLILFAVAFGTKRTETFSSALARDITAANATGQVYHNFVRETGHKLSPLQFARLINLRRTNNFSPDDIRAALAD